jgi:hypothetical protein
VALAALTFLFTAIADGFSWWEMERIEGDEIV